VLKLPRAARAAADDGRSVFRDLANETSVQRAAAMLAREGVIGGGTIESAGLIVQRQVERMSELAIEVSDDPTFGPALTLSIGRSEYRGLRAATVDLPPLNLPLAHALIAHAGTKGAPFSREALADVLVRISQLVVDFPAIAGIIVDPLFAGTDEVCIGDAAVTLRAGGEPGTLTIPPYPAELVERWTTGDETLTIRPIRPEDAEAHAAFFARLSPEDIRYRFFAALRELSPEQIAWLTQIDYDREMAFIAARDNGDTVGVARLAGEPGSDTAEFAVIVQPDMKGRGLASQLMKRLIDWARSRGLAEITGQVLADNAPMLAFVRYLGFTLHRLAEEADVFEAKLALTPAQG
jgi:acetyltransferase